jgi:AraC-like DNA-binding protein
MDGYYVATLDHQLGGDLTLPSAPTKSSVLLGHVEAVKAYIEEHLYEPLSLSDLALRGGFSMYYFARRFKELTGLSPKQYILNKRLERAHLLLSQGTLTVSDIAYQTGFTDQSHLVRYFKKMWGMTPTALRQQGHKEAATKDLLATSPLPITGTTSPLPAPLG